MSPEVAKFCQSLYQIGNFQVLHYRDDPGSTIQRCRVTHLPSGMFYELLLGERIIDAICKLYAEVERKSQCAAILNANAYPPVEHQERYPSLELR